MFILQIVGACILLAVMFGGVFLAWKQWLNLDRRLESPAWRGALGLAALFGCTAQLAILLACQLSNPLSPGFAQRLRHFTTWARVDSAIFLLTVLAAILGKGRYRTAAAASALATEVAWLLVGLGI
jgi:hypothetical protein